MKRSNKIKEKSSGTKRNLNNPLPKEFLVGMNGSLNDYGKGYIYIIRNVVNGRAYIGKTNNVIRRKA